MKQEATEEKALTIGTEIDTALKTKGGLVPQNLDQLWRLAVMMAKSGMMPTGIQTPEAVAVAVQMGLEVGLSPMSAVQNIAVINGRPSIWGDSVLGLVRASGLLEDFDEYFEIEGKRLEPSEVDQYLNSDKLTGTCIAKRKDQKTEIVRSFSVADAKKANLWGVNVWKTYPKRMLQMRPRSWTLRDGFGDVIKGLRVAEEVIDMITTNGKSFELGGDATAALNEKIKEDKKGESTEDIYKPEAEKEDEDPIRKDFINLGWKSFRAWVLNHEKAIPGMRLSTQDEIKNKWMRIREHDEPYPLDVPKDENGGRDETPPDEEESDKTETENILKLVQGAHLTESGIAITGCPNTAEGVSILRAKCDGIGLEPCESRVGCPNWAAFDKS